MILFLEFVPLIQTEKPFLRFFSYLELSQSFVRQRRTISILVEVKLMNNSMKLF